MADSSTTHQNPPVPLEDAWSKIYLDRTDLKVFVVSVLIGLILYSFA